MNALKIKLLGYLLILGLIVGAVLGGVLFYALPQYYSNWFVETWVFFMLIEAIILSYIENVSRTKKSPGKLLNAYLISKIMKLAAGAVFVGIYYTAVRLEMTSFLLTFVAFYLLFMGIETFLFSKIERQIKENS